MLELFSASLPPSSFAEVALRGVGAFADMGGKTLPDAGLAVEGFFGALADIEGRAVMLELFSPYLPPSTIVEVALRGVGAFADMGGKALREGVIWIAALDRGFKMNMSSSHGVVLLDLQVSDQGVWCKCVEGARQVSVLLIHKL